MPQNRELSEESRQHYLAQMGEVFKRALPDSMYSDHYTLTEMYGFEPQLWRVYLRDNAAFIESEMAAMIEPAARSAINRLGSATTQEVQALKALLEKSKLINDAQKQQTRIVMTFINPTKEKKKEGSEPPSNESY